MCISNVLNSKNSLKNIDFKCKFVVFSKNCFNFKNKYIDKVNPLNDDGIAIIFKSLETNQSLISIDFSGFF